MADLTGGSSAHNLRHVRVRVGVGPPGAEQPLESFEDIKNLLESTHIYSTVTINTGSSQLLVAANPLRKGLILQNINTAPAHDLDYKFGGTAVVGQGLRLCSNQEKDWGLFAPEDAVNAIATTASVTVLVTELI